MASRDSRKGFTGVTRGAWSRYIELDRKFVLRQGFCFCEPIVFD